MSVFTALDQLPADFGPSAVTFGKFDGLHAGHRAVVDELATLAGARGLVPTLLTFDRNPLSLLDPERCPESVVGLGQRRELLEGAGAEVVVELPFDRALSRLSAEDFVEQVLVGALHARLVLVGPDTRFGHRGLGTADTLVELGRGYGFDVRIHDMLRSRSGEVVSSTRVRRLLSEGDVRGATELLGRLPAVRAMVVHGQARGRQLGYPTANLSPDLEGFIPGDGVYAGFLTVEGRRMPSAISIGNNPTFEGVPAKQIEAHVIDEELDLYDKVVEVEFQEFIRGMEKYTTLDALIAQIGADTDRARAILGLAVGGS